MSAIEPENPVDAATDLFLGVCDVDTTFAVSRALSVALDTMNLGPFTSEQITSVLVEEGLDPLDAIDQFERLCTIFKAELSQSGTMRLRYFEPRGMSGFSILAQILENPNRSPSV